MIRRYLFSIALVEQCLYNKLAPPDTAGQINEELQLTGSSFGSIQSEEGT